jgi:hypothetical protein
MDSSADPAHGLREAVLRALAYADLFDYPLTFDQLHRYLIGCAATHQDLRAALADDPGLRRQVEQSAPYCYLAGRQALIELRRQREAYSRQLWPAAWRFGRLLASLPYVRLVAVTGSLSMDNAAAAMDDIDLLLVTRPGRLWLARGLAVLVVRLARAAGVHLCPNYFIAETRLRLDSPSLFVAHELAQMVPLFGTECYGRLMVRNAWMLAYLPNASPRCGQTPVLGSLARAQQRAAEGALQGGLGDALEAWESRRKIARLSAQSAGAASDESTFQPDECKGHLGAHGDWVQRRYARRLTALGLPEDVPATVLAPAVALP